MKQFSEVVALLNTAVDDEAKERILVMFAHHVISATSELLGDSWDPHLVPVADIQAFQFSDEEIQSLWDDLGNIPVIEDVRMLKERVEELAEEGITLDGTLLNTEPYIDEDFFIWPCGTAKYKIWQWFDEHYWRGVEGLAMCWEK